jgi:hypothetical protein
MQDYNQVLEILRRGGANVVADSPPSFVLTYGGLVDFALENNVCGARSARNLWGFLDRAAIIQQAGISYAKHPATATEDKLVDAIDGDTVVNARASGELYRIRGLSTRESTARHLLDKIIEYNTRET